MRNQIKHSKHDNVRINVNGNSQRGQKSPAEATGNLMHGKKKKSFKHQISSTGYQWTPKSKLSLLNNNWIDNMNKMKW